MSDLPPFEDNTVQEIYRLLCDTCPCPDGGHWEGYVARHIAKLTASRFAEVKAERDRSLVDTADAEKEWWEKRHRLALVYKQTGEKP